MSSIKLGETSADQQQHGKVQDEQDAGRGKKCARLSRPEPGRKAPSVQPKEEGWQDTQQDWQEGEESIALWIEAPPRCLVQAIGKHNTESNEDETHASP